MLDRKVKGLGLPILYLDFDGVLHPEYCYWHPRKGPTSKLLATACSNISLYWNDCSNPILRSGLCSPPPGCRPTSFLKLPASLARLFDHG